MKKKTVAAGVLLLLLTGCAGAGPSGPKWSADERKAAAAAIDPRIAEASRSFGLKLHKQMSDAGKGESVVISPASVSAALALAYTGSSGETAEKIAAALGWDGMSENELNEANRRMTELLTASGGGVKLTIANSVWTAAHTVFHKPYLQTVKDYYQAEVRSADFSSPKTTDVINSWVSKRTEGKIRKLLEEQLPADSAAVLLNAVYFNASWTDPFKKGDTQDDNFTLPDGTVKKLPMMRQTRTYAYSEHEAWQAVKLPYGDGRMNMLLVLPKETSSLDELNRQLWSDCLPCRQTFEPVRVDLRLPKFKVEYTAQLKDALTGIGMSLAFDPGRADFRKMADVHPLYISGVTHKTYLDVNEEGTEAAAATGAMMAGSAPPSKPVDMIVNRPFFFAIEDSHTGSWLFLGTITNP
ncbi:MAG: hypothetical protein K0Q94_6040 [Paenibacillus sp.]|jgi:serpin B|uniref:serpin family protein n=1 Tax=Paenibacillus sp. GCM10012303 TaxID=3317340 RepID=UPI0029EEEDE6|nr:hypothetical protein [Paenibacillus sp.]